MILLAAFLHLEYSQSNISITLRLERRSSVSQQLSVMLHNFWAVKYYITLLPGPNRAALYGFKRIFSVLTLWSALILMTYA